MSSCGPCVSNVLGKMAALLKPTSERGYYTGRFDFLLSSIGYIVGLGNMWVFPSSCYANGGGAFLIPYVIMIAVIGLPLIFLEMAFGQATNMGPVHGWKACPMMTGMGWAMCFVTTTICIYYNVIIAWSFYYLFASMSSRLPWNDCNNEWNDELCLESLKGEGSTDANRLVGCSDKVKVNCTAYETPTVQYFERVALGFVSYNGTLRKMSDPVGVPRIRIVMCLFLSWVIVYFCLLKGIKSISKIAYFTVIFPLIVSLVLLVRGLTLPGASTGLKMLFRPDFASLAKVQVWVSATKTAFFSLGIGLGGLTTLASYNNVANNCHRDALITTSLDLTTSIVCSVTMFSVLGNMALRTGLPISRVAKEGMGLAFIVYTECVGTLPAGQFWSVLFFITLIALGMDSQFTMMEIPLTAMQDQWPGWRSSFKMEALSKGTFCFALFLLGVPMCCQGGVYMFEIFYNFTAEYNVYIIALGEIFGVCCFYGLRNFISDVRNMLGFKPGIYWVICWVVFCPVLIGFMLISSLATYQRPMVSGNQPMTSWGEAIGWLIMLSSLLIVIGYSSLRQPSIVSNEQVHASEDALRERLLRVIGMDKGEPRGRLQRSQELEWIVTNSRQ